jgi:hypothetical protein
MNSGFVCGAVCEAFAQTTPGPATVDWNAREVAAAAVLRARGVPGEEVFFGGDGLRPYLTVTAAGSTIIARCASRGLTDPPLIREVDRGEFGAAEWAQPCAVDHELEVITLRSSLELDSRLRVPNVALVSLTNSQRYRAVRFPLNIARLAQWLRYSHSGRSYPFDATLDAGGDLDSLLGKATRCFPDLLGISVNFGELDRLTEFVEHLRSAEVRPYLVIGNVLAAWAPDDVRRTCDGFDVALARSYGEGVLDDLVASWRRTGEFSLSSHRELASPPEQVILPDESLIDRTIRAGGQLSLETSFGCQFGTCTFCPRDHRGKGWQRGSASEVIAVIESLGTRLRFSSPSKSSVLSFVDEDALGAEGRALELGAPSMIEIVNATVRAGFTAEIYTRLEQICDLRRSDDWNLARFEHFLEIRGGLARVFVGVESGVNSQLKRFGKGQTVAGIVDALRAGSLLGLPVEFGFITFDPLVSASELASTIEFLARRDVLLPYDELLQPSDVIRVIHAQRDSAHVLGEPVYSRVAYIATELEVLGSSPYARMLVRRYPHLVGRYDGSFGRFEYKYLDARLEPIAGWCRVWTEGAFPAIYRLRLLGRSGEPLPPSATNVVAKYRVASFALLVGLAIQCLPEVRPRLVPIHEEVVTRWELPSLARGLDVEVLRTLWEWCAGREGAAACSGSGVHFDTMVREHPRAT